MEQIQQKAVHMNYIKADIYFAIHTCNRLGFYAEIQIISGTVCRKIIQRLSLLFSLSMHTNNAKDYISERI